MPCRLEQNMNMATLYISKKLYMHFQNSTEVLQAKWQLFPNHGIDKALIEMLMD